MTKTSTRLTLERQLVHYRSYTKCQTPDRLLDLTCPVSYKGWPSPVRKKLLTLQLGPVSAWPLAPFFCVVENSLTFFLMNLFFRKLYMVLQTVMVLSICSTAQCKRTCIMFFLFIIFQRLFHISRGELIAYTIEDVFFFTQTKLHMI